MVLLPTDTTEETPIATRKTGGSKDTDNSTQMAGDTNKAVQVLYLAVLSGITSPARVELVCWSICKVCRESATWSVRVIKPHLARYNVFGRYLFPELEEEDKTVAPSSDTDSSMDVKSLKEDNFTAAAAIAIACSINAFSGSSTVSSAGINNGIEGNRLAPVISSTGEKQKSAVTGDGTSRTIPRHRNIARLLYLSNNPLSAHIHWPTTLRTLALGWMFDNRICSSQLPQTILELDLGGGFNHQIDTISWPPGLLKLRTGGSFNRPIELATFPAGLQTLILGNRFNQPIEGVVWPTGLMHLELGGAFDQPIVHAGWDSTNLRVLRFGRAFDHPVQGVRWPPTLRELSFGHLFNSLCDPRELPFSLQLLRLSDLVEQDPDMIRDKLPKGCVLEIFHADLSWRAPYGVEWPL